MGDYEGPPRRRRDSTGDTFQGYDLSYVKAYCGKKNRFLCGQACANYGNPLKGCRRPKCNIVDFGQNGDWMKLCKKDVTTGSLVYFKNSALTHFDQSGEVEEGTKIYCNECYQQHLEENGDC